VRNIGLFSSNLGAHLHEALNLNTLQFPRRVTCARTAQHRIRHTTLRALMHMCGYTESCRHILFMHMNELYHIYQTPYVSHICDITHSYVWIHRVMPYHLIHTYEWVVSHICNSSYITIPRRVTCDCNTLQHIATHCNTLHHRYVTRVLSQFPRRVTCARTARHRIGRTTLRAHTSTSQTHFLQLYMWFRLVHVICGVD